MIESVRIRNFRCFEDVEAKNLGLINIVVGDNASGKTSLLEALYLCATNSAEAHLKFLGWRGASMTGIGNRLSIRTNQSKYSSGEFWSDLFFQDDISRVVQIDVEGKPSRSVKVRIRASEPSVTVIKSEDGSEDREWKASIVFAWRQSSGKWIETVPVFSEKILRLPQASGSISGAFITEPVPPSDLAERYSELDVTEDSNVVRETVSAVFPQVRSLSIQVDLLTGQPAVFAELSGMPGKHPLYLVSAGINRVAYIVATIAKFKEGSIYIDEFAKGVYHLRIESLWKGIIEAAKASKTQDFLSTHSGEALEALLPLMKGNQRHIRLLRVTRSEAGASTISVHDGKSLAAALESGFELR